MSEPESPRTGSEPGSFNDLTDDSLLGEATKKSEEINELLNSVNETTFENAPEKGHTEEEVVDLDQTDESSRRESNASEESELSELSEKVEDEMEEYENWNLTLEDRQEFAKQFQMCDTDHDGFILESQKQEVFQVDDQSLLNRIWKLSDINRDHKLNFDEFCIARFLIRAYAHGEELPPHLPEAFLASVNPELLNVVSPVIGKEKDRKKKSKAQEIQKADNREALSMSDSPNFTQIPTMKRKSKTELLLGVKAIDEDKLFLLVQKMIDPKKGIPTKTHKTFLKSYKNTFLGKDLVDWLIVRNIGKTRERAGKLGIVLLEKNYIHHAIKDNDKKFRFVFKESHLFQFSDPEKMKKPNESDYRICIIGEGKSGKTSLAVRISKNEFLQEHFNFEKTGPETVYTKKNFDTKDGEKVNIELMDTETVIGNEFEANLAKWSEWATGYMIVFNITSKASFDAVPKIFTTLVKVRSFRMTPVILVGTNGDATESRKISLEDAEQVAQRYRCSYIETSSLSGKGINELLVELAQNIKSVNDLMGTTNHKSGWMKMRAQGKNWKKRYYILTESGLRYYSQPPASENDSSSLKGVIPMLNCKIQSSPFIAGKTEEDPRKLSRKPSTNSVPKDKFKFHLMDRNKVTYELFFHTEELRNQLYHGIEQRIESQSSHNRSRAPSEIESPENVEKQEAQLSKEEILQKGIQLFNKNPKKGIAFLISKNILKDDIQEVTDFLYNEASLKRAAVGEFIGTGNGFNSNVLANYVKKFSFKSFEFDEALRLFLSKFTLPREAQQIDRIMEKFALGYCETNPTAFETSDVGYILAFSLIMLNTDAHNPNIKPENKMTKTQFVHNNRGINNGKDLDQAYLERLYDSIVKNEIQMHHERDEFAQWDKQGWVHIQTVKLKEKKVESISRKTNNLGKRLWCIISSCCLYTFENPADKKPLHIIPLSNLQIDSISSKDGDQDQFSAFTLHNPHSVIKTAVGGKEIQLKEIVFHFDNPKAKCEWMLVIKVNLVSGLVYSK